MNKAVILLSAVHYDAEVDKETDDEKKLAQSVSN
jgi:PHD/YefM family antitoxin component YafN of YafNO toxin-antitoxin module